MRTIREVEVFPIRVPVTAGFRFASGSAGAAGEAAPLVLVRITDSEGCSGWGEGRPMPQWSYETLESAVTAIRGCDEVGVKLNRTSCPAVVVAGVTAPPSIEIAGVITS